MLRHTIAVSVAVTSLMMTASACSTEGHDNNGLLVVTTTTMLKDIATNIVGDLGRVETMIPNGMDPHDFQATSKQAALALQADLVIANGLGLEGELLDLLNAARSEGANVLTLGPLLDPLPLSFAPVVDPHIWMDPIRVAAGALIIADELTALVPEAIWRDNAEIYAQKLAAVDNDIRALLATLPKDRRKLITNHDTLGYYAARYDLNVVGTVIPGGSTTDNPSSLQLAKIVATIENEQVPAIFVGITEPSAIARAIADDLGESVVVVELNTESLGKVGSGMESLIDLLIRNTEHIVAALG